MGAVVVLAGKYSVRKAAEEAGARGNPMWASEKWQERSLLAAGLLIVAASVAALIIGWLL